MNRDVCAVSLRVSPDAHVYHCLRVGHGVGHCLRVNDDVRVSVVCWCVLLCVLYVGCGRGIMCVLCVSVSIMMRIFLAAREKKSVRQSS